MQIPKKEKKGTKCMENLGEIFHEFKEASYAISLHV